MLTNFARVVGVLLFVPCIVALRPGTANAQAVQTYVVAPSQPPMAELPEPPSFGLSIGLHVGAIISSVVGTAGIAGGFLSALASAFGGSGDGGVGAGLGIGGAVLLTAGIALGISASAVHANTRSRRDQYAALPFVWADATGAGGGFTLRY